MKVIGFTAVAVDSGSPFASGTLFFAANTGAATRSEAQARRRASGSMVGMGKEWRLARSLFGGKYPRACNFGRVYGMKCEAPLWNRLLSPV